MKKLISSLLAFAMVLALFSGVVVFNTSAGNAGAEGEQATTEAYVYYPLTGFTKTTQAELDKLQGNVSYAAGDSSVAQDCSSKAELTSNPGEIKLTKNPKVNNNHQNLCTYKAADGETAAGATLNDNIWAPLDANVTYDDMDGIRFKLVDSEGEPVSACIWLRPIFTGDERGWDAYWTYEGVPEIDDDGYLCIEFARFSRHQTSGYANTSKHSVRLLMAVADAMYLRICNAPSVVYFSDLQGFKRNEKRSANMVFVDLPGFESWTDENLAANNALTGPIPDTDPVEYYPNSVLAFTTDAAVLRGDATKGLVSTSDWPRGGYTQMWSTRTERSASATQQNGHIFGEYNTVDKLQQFDGIRIGLSAPDGSDPFPYSSEWHHHTTIRTTLYGPSFQSSTATPSFRATYSYMGGQTAATADPYGVYEDGYIYIYFSDLINGGSGVWRTSGFTYFNSTAVYENLTVELVGGENNKTASTRLVLSDMQLFKKIRIDKSALKEAIKTVAGYGVSQFDEQLAAARAVYNNKEATQEEVDAQVAILNECISGFKFNYDNVKADLNDMLELADNLGFFYSTYARYEEISLADQYYTNNTNPASFENLLAEVRVVRDCVADEAMKGETCYALFKAANNAWRYNYTDPSYIALYIALSDAWDAYIADEGFDEAVAALQAAYDALVPATVKTNTANFFEGWTDTAVNDVVDANEYKDGTTLNKVDSIGDGLNRPKVYNNGDFTNNTTFEADDNFKMTADADFAGKSMGWKNMDRSGTLASGKNFGYPVMNVTGLSQSDGVRLKIEVENGSVQRLLLGLSNCTSGITREDYAMLISPDVVDEEGYINIPFSYFVNAHWASQKFTKSELEQVIVFIVEAYGVTKDTEITLSDLRGYQLTGASVDKTKLASVIAAVEALDTDKYDAEIAAAKAIYNDSFATQAEVDAQVKILNTCLDNFNNPPVNGYTYVQLNGVQNWTAEDVARLHKYGASFAISDKGLIGKATQSIELTVTDNKMRYCLSSNVDNPSGFLEKNAFSFVNAEAGYKLSDFDGIAIAFADADGNEIPISTFQPRLMRSSSDWNNFTAYQVSYSDIKAIYKNGYYHLKFSDFKNLPGDAINDICIPSILFYTGLNAGEKAYISDFCAYRYDESAAPVEQKTKREYVQLDGVQKWTANEIASLENFGASFALSDKGLIGNATQSVELTVTSAPSEKQRFCMASKTTSNGFLAKSPFAFTDTTAGYKLSDFDGIAIAFSDADGKELPITQFQCRLMRGSNDWSNYQAVEANYFDIPAVYKDGYYHLRFRDYTHLAGAIDDVYILSVLFYKSIKVGDKAYISDMLAYRDVPDLDDIVADLWEYNYTADSWTAYSEAAAVATTAAEAEAAVALLVPRKTVAVTENFFKGWTNKMVNDVVEANTHRLCDSIGDGLNRKDVWNDGDFSNNTTFDAGDGWFSMTTTVDLLNGSIGWKNMDRNKVYQPADNGAYPALTVAGLSKAEGLRLKLEVTGKAERLLIGLSNCSKFVREQYALKIKPEYVDADGYINIPFTYFEKAWWCDAFTQAELEDVIVFIVEAYGVTKDTTIKISDPHGYITREFDDSALPSWEYNYTAESWAAYSEAIAVAKTADERDAAIALLKAYPTKPVTENFFKGWTNKMVNDVVEANTHRLCDSIGDGLNRKDVWNDGDFSNNTTFDAGDGWFSMTTTVDLLNGSIGWKNMDRNKVYQPADNGAYPALTVAGLSKAEGLRLKLEVTGKAERLLIGLSNCSKFVREQYALKIKPEYVDADGYINIPFTYFEKAWWCDAFAQAELEDVIVFIVEAYGVEKDTTIKLSDVHGYKELIPATDADFEALNAAVNALKAIDLDGNKFADLYALAEGVANSNDHEEVAPVTAQLNAKLAELGDADRAPVKAKIAELDALDETDYFADERASFKQRYYGALDAEGVAALIADIQACIDQFSVPEAPEAPTAAVVEPTRVVLNTIEGAEYKCGDGEWQKSAAFADLTPNTEYTFYARYPAAGVSAASEPSEALVVKTAKETISGSVVISGDARYGATATAEVELTLTNAYDLVIEWYTTTGNKLGTGATYTFAAADIGATVLVKVTSEALEGELTSDTFGPIGKALVTVTELPTADKLPLGMTLANCILTGGVTDVEGVWAFADPDIIPEYEQSGSEFDIVFTPNEPDLYEVYTAKLAVEINAVTEAKTVINTENGGKVELSGDFHNTAVTTFEMTNIATANKTAYIDLLRAANRSGSTKNIIFMYTIDFGTPIAPYIGTLTFKAEVGESRVGETYTVWFFTKDGVTSREGVVDADGNITVEGLKF